MEMADNTSAGATGWRKRMLSPSLQSDLTLSYGNLLFSSHENEYEVCEALCESSKGSSELFSAAKVLGRRVTNVYISSPMLLALGPFLFGLFLGWIGNKIWNYYFGSQKHNTKQRAKRDGKTHPKTSYKQRPTDNENEYTSLRTQMITTLAILFSSLISLITSLRNLLLRNEVQIREDEARKKLTSAAETMRESGVELQHVPNHIAVIMDGNRRYGKAKYGSISKGHWDGSKKLVEFSKWCLAEQIQIVTVYAFSTENWSRDANEISSLMKIFSKYCDELREEAVKRGIKIRVLSTEGEKLPSDVQTGIKRMVEETAKGDKLLMNICLSYGSRGEIVNACKSIFSDIQQEKIQLQDISEEELGKRLLTGSNPDPDIVIRTSGEFRLSNFLLWQLAYSEMFFLDMSWPEITKADLIQIIQGYANNRKRRFGK